MRRRILLVGATGAFGSRLARLLARWDVDLILSARRVEPLRALARELGGPARIETVALDRRAPDLAGLALWAVVDAAGPFQASDLTLARAAVAAGAHYVDIADGRDFVARFPAALDADARAAGVLAVTGASSTPALSAAALDQLTAGWRAIDTARVTISPGARARRAAVRWWRLSCPMSAVRFASSPAAVGPNARAGAAHAACTFPASVAGGPRSATRPTST